MAREEEDGAAHAFRWIVDLPRGKDIPFQVTGGLAARAYGATRPLADIDLYVPGQRLPELLPDVATYVTFGPAPYRDDHWNLTWMALHYHGQRIEIGDGHRVRIFDRQAGCWVDASVDFEVFEQKTLFGRTVPVMPRDRLIAYKRRLDRPVDAVDISGLSLSLRDAAL